MPFLDEDEDIILACLSSATVERENIFLVLAGEINFKNIKFCLLKIIWFWPW